MSAALGAYLVAYAVISGTATDRTGALIGGLSSARWDAARSELVMISDRGPGDGTVPYQPRFHRFGVEVTTGSLSLSLRESVPFVTRKGEAFTGLAVTTAPRLDPEGLALEADGGLWVSDEYGPFVYRFDARGRETAKLSPPREFLPGPGKGRTDNQGLESLCLAPDNGALVAVLQSPLAQEGGRAGPETRVLVWTKPWRDAPPRGYRLPRVDPEAENLPIERKETGFNECVALSSSSLLLLERDGRGLGLEGAKGRPAYKRAVFVELRDDGRAVRGDSIDLLSPLVEAGLKPESIPPKFESLEPGPSVGGSRTLWVVVDNDFQAETPSMVFLLGLR